MKIDTTLPVASFAFKQWDETDREVSILLVKAHFVQRADGRFIADPEPPEMRVADDMAPGEPGYTELKHEQDLFPTKPATDLLVRGIARTPGGRRMPQWPVTVEIPDKLHYSFLVRGPAEWRRSITGWRMTDPEPVSEVPLRYGLAYGGGGPGKKPDDPPEAHELNPAGQGFASTGMLDKGDPFPAPQIGLIGDFASSQVDKPMTVCGTMPIAKSWLPRRVEAGTFDERWKKTRHPMMPKDYSLSFWNCAPVPLQLLPHLNGDETIRLSGFFTHSDTIEMTLPGVGLVAKLTRFGEVEPDGTFPVTEIGEVRMTVSTVELDVQSDDTENHRITIVWAASTSEEFDGATIGAVRLAPRKETVPA